MPTDVSIRIGVDGEKEFRSALSAVNAQIKNLNSEMKSVVTSMSGMDNAEEKAANRRMCWDDQWTLRVRRLPQYPASMTDKSKNWNNSGTNLTTF